jgi:hypothetical protein
MGVSFFRVLSVFIHIPASNVEKRIVFFEGNGKAVSGIADCRFFDFGLSVGDCRFSIEAVDFDPGGKHRKKLGQGHNDTCNIFQASIHTLARRVKRQNVRDRMSG